MIFIPYHPQSLRMCLRWCFGENSRHDLRAWLLWSLESWPVYDLCTKCGCSYMANSEMQGRHVFVSTAFLCRTVRIDCDMLQKFLRVIVVIGELWRVFIAEIDTFLFNWSVLSFKMRLYRRSWLLHSHTLLTISHVGWQASMTSLQQPLQKQYKGCRWEMD